MNSIATMLSADPSSGGMLAQFINQPPQYFVTLFLGAIAVFAFARERYDVPTWAKTSFGNLAQLSPKSLAPDYRYRKGLHLYLLCMLGTYFALCLIGPKIGDIPGLPVHEALRDFMLWPMGAASMLAVAGAVGDDKFPGRIEGFFRRKAHELAYIPTAVTKLSYQLTTFRLADWLRAQTDDQCVQVQKRVGGVQVCPLDQVAVLTEGSLVSWARGNVLLHCLGELSGPSYDPIKAQEENREAVRFLSALRESIAGRLPRFAPDQALEEGLGKDIDSFLDGTAELLAATLLQAAPDAFELSEKLSDLGFTDIDLAGRQGWTQLSVFVIAAVGIAIFVTGALAYTASPQSLIDLASILKPSLKDLSEAELTNLGDAITQMAVSAFVLYALAFVILMYLRERWLNEKRWEYTLGSHLDFAWRAGLLTGVASTFVIVLIPGIPLQGVIIIFLFNTVIAIVAAAFFVHHMRRAASTPRAGWPFVARVFGLGVAAQALLTVAITIGLTLVTAKWNYEHAPEDSLEAAGAWLEDIDKLFAAGGGIPTNLANWPASDQTKQLRAAFGTLKQSFKSSDVPKASPQVLESLSENTERVCSLLNMSMPLSFRPFVSADPDTTDSACAPALRQPNNMFEGNILGLAAHLGSTWFNLDSLKKYLEPGGSGAVWMNAILAGFFALVAALTFALAVRFGRSQQLANTLDRFDESTIKRLVDRARAHFAECGMPFEEDKWLVTPTKGSRFLTPAEAIRYQYYRPSLFDSLPIKPKQQAEQPPIHIVAGGGKLS